MSTDSPAKRRGDGVAPSMSRLRGSAPVWRPSLFHPSTLGRRWLKSNSETRLKIPAVGRSEDMVVFNVKNAKLVPTPNPNHVT